VPRRLNHPRVEYEAEIISSASYFTVCFFREHGTYDRVEFPTLEDARYAAVSRGRGVIYAVDRAGSTICVG
jgi:hypothetical protein